MQKTIQITGASQRTSVNGAGERGAWYECHKCGEEFACSSEYCGDEATAREESKSRFDLQQRRFCYRCGHKLTTAELNPENAYIAELNEKIDKLRTKRIEDLERIKTLQDAMNGYSDAERFAIHKGWIRAVAYNDFEPKEDAHDE